MKTTIILSAIAAGMPRIFFLHHWGTGPVEKLAAGLKAALDQTGHGETH